MALFTYSLIRFKNRDEVCDWSGLISFGLFGWSIRLIYLVYLPDLNEEWVDAGMRSRSWVGRSPQARPYFAIAFISQLFHSSKAVTSLFR